MYIEKLKKTNPLVLNITNSVVQDFTANTLLSVGASPIMSNDIREIKELISISSALSINIGTLSEDFEKIAILATELATERGVPIVLDPVGNGVTKSRTNLTNAIINIAKNSSQFVIKGNASEILSIKTSSSGKGVDSALSSDDAIDIGMEISEEYNCVVCITGKNDYVFHAAQNEYYVLSNGTKMAQKITGMGCTLGAIIASFATLDKTIQPIIYGISMFNIASEIAEKESNGLYGSFKVKLLDLLGAITDKEIEELQKKKLLK